MVGASTIYGLSWLVLLVIPMLAIVQTIASRVGAVSKKGLEDCIRDAYGRGWALFVLAAILIVNVLTLAADLEGGAAALHVLSGVDYRWFVIPFAALVAGRDRRGGNVPLQDRDRHVVTFVRRAGTWQM